MTPYHVSFDTEHTDGCFHPRVPGTAAVREDRTIPRICLSDSIEHCLQAMSGYNRKNLLIGCTMVVYSVDSDDIPSSCLVSPEELVERKLVLDAVENREYWVLEDLHMRREAFQVQDFSYDYAFAFSCMNAADVRSIIADIFPELALPDTDSTQQLYQTAMDFAHEHNRHKGDKIQDAIAELPLSRKVEFSGLVLTPVQQEEDLERE